MKKRYRGWHLQVQPDKAVSVLFDPTGIFNPGARFRAAEVFGVGNLFERSNIDGLIPAPDELPAGIEIVHAGVIMRNDAKRGLVVIGKL